MWQLILGPILGTVGGLFNRWLDLKGEKQKAEEREKERGHELAVMDKEYALAERKATLEASIRESEADARAFEASYQFANERLLPDGTKLTPGQRWLALGVDAFTRLIRPTSTVWYQLALAGVFVWSALELRRRGMDALSAEQLGTLVSEIVYSIVAIAETTLFWWFGIRGTSKRGAAK